MSIKMLLLCLTIFLSAKANAQLSNNDTIPDNILNRDCDGKLFTRVEKIATLKISVENFQDSLSKLFKAKNVIFVTEKVTYRFFLTSQNEIFDFQKLSGKVENEEKLKETFLSLSSLWNAAIQNGRKVCAYTRLEITNNNEKLLIRIFQ